MSPSRRGVAMSRLVLADFGHDLAVIGHPFDSEMVAISLGSVPSDRLGHDLRMFPGTEKESRVRVPQLVQMQLVEIGMPSPVRLVLRDRHEAVYPGTREVTCR
jgi:hypothetical protein